MTFIEKIKAYLKSAGIRSVVYLLAGFSAKLLLGSEFLFGIGLGIFLADNWVTIKELINKNLK